MKSTQNARTVLCTKKLVISFIVRNNVYYASAEMLVYVKLRDYIKKEWPSSSSSEDLKEYNCIHLYLI